LKDFAVDVFGVKKIGANRWRKEFFWPVTDDEYFALVREISRVFFDQVRNTSQTLQDIMLSNVALLQQYSMIMHTLLVITRIREMGYDLVFDDRSRYYSDILAQRNAEPAGQVRPSFSQRFRNNLKHMIKLLGRNHFSCGSIVKKVMTEKRVVSLGSFGHLKGEYCRRNKLIVSHMSSIDFLRLLPSTAQRHAKVEEIEERTDCLVERLLEVSRGIGLFSDEFLERYLKGVSAQMLYISYWVYWKIIRDFARKIDLLLLGEVAKPLNKAISFGLKNRFGTRIVGFEHGNTFGCHLSPFFAANELSHCDEYVVSTKKSIRNYVEAQKESICPYGIETQISSTGTDFYRILASKNHQCPLPRKIETVMLIGFPMNQYRYLGFPGHFSMMHLHLELRLLDFMNRMGFRTVYKVHPDRKKEAEGIFEEFSGSVTSEPFENVVHLCDAYLFAHTDTSAFGIAVCTNRPIIVIEIEGKIWRGNSFELVSKRCRIVQAWIDKWGRVIFDEKCLKEALREEVEEPNQEYFQGLMID